MAVLVSREPERRYQKIGGIGATQSEREQADRLDRCVEKRIRKLIENLNAKNLMPSERGKGSLDAYWELGKAIKGIVESKDFPHKAELPLLWRSIKMHLPDERLLYKQRGPYREHLWYCYRLANYSKTMVHRMKWGEWVTIFDSSGINQEERFDTWFHDKLAVEKGKIERSLIRMFAPCVNKLLGNIDLSDLSDQELSNCYEATWKIAVEWHREKSTNPDYGDKREDVQGKIEAEYYSVDGVMDGTVTASDFAVRVLGFCADL